MHTAPEEVDNGHGVWPSKVNMYQDVLPNPKTRVRLATFNSDPSTDYINANYVRDRSGKFTWIAAQGPMDSTINNFWRMIWEKKIPVVIMLTKTVEGNVKKCAKYLPKLVGRPERRGFFDVTLESFEGFPEGNGKKSCFRSNIKMTLRRKNGTVEERSLIHFWLNSWPDHGRPKNATHMLTLAASIRKLRNSVKRKLLRPTLVHCSAGVGRTGSFIAMIDILDAVEAGEKVDINAIIARIRNDRCRLVNSVLQYEFLWDAAYEYLYNGIHAVKCKEITLPRLEPGTNPGFTLSGPRVVHVGNVNDEILNAFFIKSVKPGSVADKSGFEPGQRIEEISHAGIPKDKNGIQKVFRMKGKTLTVVKGELLRGIAAREPVILKVSRQMIAMEAQEQLRNEETDHRGTSSRRVSKSDNDEGEQLITRRRIQMMKSMYHREKKERDAEVAEETALVEAVEEYDAQKEREYEERVLQEMEQIATEEAELLSGHPSIARLDSTELKNRVVAEHFGKLGVEDTYLTMPETTDSRGDNAVTQSDSFLANSFNSVDKLNWTDDKFMDKMFGHARTNSYTEATKSSTALSTTSLSTNSISSDVTTELLSDDDRKLKPAEAAAAGVPRHIFRKLDTDNDGLVALSQLRKASEEGLLPQDSENSIAEERDSIASAGVPFRSSESPNPTEPLLGDATSIPHTVIEISPEVEGQPYLQDTGTENAEAYVDV